MSSPASKRASLQATYNAIGTEFSASRAYIWPDLKPFVDEVELNSSVLDVGCGNGRLLLGLPQTTQYTGLDFSSTLLAQAQTAHPKARFIEADITKAATWANLPQFDYIFCIAVIHHLPTRKEQLFVLKQIKSHLRPGGQCLITAWNLWQPQLLKHHLDIKTKLENHHYVYIPFQGHPRFHFAHTKPYLEGLLREINFPLVVEKSSRNYLIHT